MPHRIELTEGEAVEIGGVPVAIGLARGRRVVLFVAGDDGSGLIEGREECQRSAAKLRAKIDNPPDGRHDY